MRRAMTVLIVTVLMTTVMAGQAKAEEQGDGMQQGHMMDGKKAMAEKKGMMGDMPMMDKMGDMMGGMMCREIIATEDGGIVVVLGNMLIKYDKKLELVKKTMIDISDEDMQQMMQKMKKHCGMCRKMCQQMTENEKASKEE